MITETILENGLVKRKSDKGVYIKNEQTGSEHTSAVDMPNEERIKHGLEPYTYIETDRVIETDTTNEIIEEIIAKAKAYDILVGGEE